MFSGSSSWGQTSGWWCVQDSKPPLLYSSKLWWVCILKTKIEALWQFLLPRPFLLFYVNLLSSKEHGHANISLLNHANCRWWLVPPSAVSFAIGETVGYEWRITSRHLPDEITALEPHILIFISTYLKPAHFSINYGTFLLNCLEESVPSRNLSPICAQS